MASTTGTKPHATTKADATEAAYANAHISQAGVDASPKTGERETLSGMQAASYAAYAL